MNIRSLTLAFLLATLPSAAFAQATFTKITTGAVVTDSTLSQNCAWGDFNNDGFVDLFVANYNSAATARNSVYQNNGDGTFTKLTTNSIATAGGSFSSGVWADWDNDGLLDLYVVDYRGANSFYRNLGNGAFARVPASLTPMPRTPGDFYGGAAWGDYDKDGFVDLFVSLPGINNVLYRNIGDGTFAEAAASAVTDEGGSSTTGLWGDYDDDGHLDLFVPNGHSESDFLYRNNGDGTFAKMTDGSVISDDVESWGSAWGDYNNDGYLDLAVAVYGDARLPGRSLLYRNSGDGAFELVSDSVIGAAAAGSVACAWGDYDNDGFLDLFMANGLNGNARNFLFHNNGDGTFSKITSGPPVNESVESIGAAWGDYDNDGFLDLYVANGNSSSQRNHLFHNDGNSNNWLNVKLVGTISNRSAIGAKVRVKAPIKGKTFWQLREISGTGQNDLRASFGLGDAVVAEIVRIEWPSGIVQELHNVTARQFLTVTESLQITMTSLGRLRVHGANDVDYAVEVSEDLSRWTRAGAVKGGAEFVDAQAERRAARFYRAVAP